MSTNAAADQHRKSPAFGKSHRRSSSLEKIDTSFTSPKSPKTSGRASPFSPNGRISPFSPRKLLSWRSKDKDKEKEKDSAINNSPSISKLKSTKRGSSLTSLDENQNFETHSNWDDNASLGSYRIGITRPSYTSSHNKPPRNNAAQPPPHEINHLDKHLESYDDNDTDEEDDLFSIGNSTVHSVDTHTSRRIGITRPAYTSAYHNDATPQSDTDNNAASNTYAGGDANATIRKLMQGTKPAASPNFTSPSNKHQPHTLATIHTLSEESEDAEEEDDDDVQRVFHMPTATRTITLPVAPSTEPSIHYLESSDKSTTTEQNLLFDAAVQISKLRQKEQNLDIQSTMSQDASETTEDNGALSPQSVTSTKSRLFSQYDSSPRSPTMTTKILYKIFILLLDPSSRIFELVAVEYAAKTATLRLVLSLIPQAATESNLANLPIYALCRPCGQGTELTNLDALASNFSSRRSSVQMQRQNQNQNKQQPRIKHGEILLAVPNGYSGQACVRMAQPILRNERMMRLLSRIDPLRPKDDDINLEVNATTLEPSSSSSTTASKPQVLNPPAPSSPLGSSTSATMEDNASVATSNYSHQHLSHNEQMAQIHAKAMDAASKAAAEVLAEKMAEMNLLMSSYMKNQNQNSNTSPSTSPSTSPKHASSSSSKRSSSSFLSRKNNHHQRQQQSEQQRINLAQSKSDEQNNENIHPYNVNLSPSSTTKRTLFGRKTHSSSSPAPQTPSTKPISTSTPTTGSRPNTPADVMFAQHMKEKINKEIMVLMSNSSSSPPHPPSLPPPPKLPLQQRRRQRHTIDKDEYEYQDDDAPFITTHSNSRNCDMSDITDSVAYQSIRSTPSKTRKSNNAATRGIGFGGIGADHSHSPPSPPPPPRRFILNGTKTPRMTRDSFSSSLRWAKKGDRWSQLMVDEDMPAL